MVLQPKIDKVWTIDDYKATHIQMKLDEISVVYKFDLHRKTSEIVCRDLMKATANMRKMGNLVKKGERKKKHEKSANKGEQLKIESLKHKAISIGVNVEDPQFVQYLLREKKLRFMY